MKIKTSSLGRYLSLSGCVLTAAAATTSLAQPVPKNLVNGLDVLVANSLAQKSATSTKTARGTAAVSPVSSALAKSAAAYTKAAIVDPSSGKYLVEIMPDGTVDLATLRTNLLLSYPSLVITATDTKYAGHGVLEGYILLADASGIASVNGVGSVILELKPIHNAGAVTSNGINQHRVNRINTGYNSASLYNYDGTGMQIGVMSDSYNSQPSEEGGATTAQQDVASGDLPGTGNTSNSQPVVVLQDYNPTPGATNEGRGMCQIVADMAPQARIGFATADTGEVGFANNIRALGALSGFTYDAATQQGFKADVICDDVSYLDEPMFQDGVVAQGVIDVVNAGITYCSSAANNWGTDGYASTYRPVPNGAGLTAAAGNTALAGTNIDLTGVDASLYKGGFHNFSTTGLDVAQTFNTAQDPQGAVFQWNDPFDSTAPTLGALVYGPVTGTSTGGSANSYTVPFTAGQGYLIVEKATPANPTENFDAIIDIIDPTGATVLTQDTGTDETVAYVASLSGNFTIRVRPYSTAAPVGGVGVPTMGTFSLQVNQANGIVARITQDFNLLFFTTAGKFISAVASNNFASNRPYEVFVPTFNADGYTQVQLVIARANATAPAVAATQLKYVFFGNGISGVGPAEYNNYLTPVTFGHSAAAGANSVAAYSMYRPNLPEDFTSPGPVTIYFDANNNRLSTPQVRQKPDIAAADGANNTFFPLGPGGDYPFDIDTFPNFYGTSAAAPHSAAVAALVIQAHKPAVLTPAQVKGLMQMNAFPHDLDPYASSGTVTAPNGGVVTVKIVSDNSSNTNTGSKDLNSWTVGYTGSGKVTNITFNPEGTAATGGNPTGGNFKGVTPAQMLDTTFYNFTPGMVFSNASTSFKPGSGDVTPSAAFSNAAPAPSTSGYYWTMNVTLGAGLASGKVAHFNVTRQQQQDCQAPQGMTMASIFGQTDTYSADILGSGVFIPEYADNPVIQPGMTFNATVVDGANTYTVASRIVNNVGAGYSPLDGYGFVNAQAATRAIVPTIGVASRKVHGTAGTFDLNLPLAGAIAIEPRLPGTNNSYQLVYSFDQTVNGNYIGTAHVDQGTGTIASTVLGPQANQVTVNLTGVTNAQHLVVSLTGAQGNSGSVLSTLSARMDVLIGDVTGSGRTDNADLTVIRQKVVSTVDSTNFLYDVNESGRIDNGDLAVARPYIVTALP